MFFGGIPSSVSRSIPRWSNVHGMPINVSLQNIMAVMIVSTLILTLANKSSGGVWRPSTIATKESGQPLWKILIM